MFKKCKVKRKFKKEINIANISSLVYSGMLIDEIKKNMIKLGIATAEQIAAAEIEIQKKESMNNGKIDNGETDRLEDVLEP